MTVTSAPLVEVFLDVRAELAEGPVPDPDGRTVHWIDLFAGHVHRTDLAGGPTTSVTVDTTVGAVGLRNVGGYVAAVADGFATVSAAGGFDLRVDLLPAGLRMNDAACDAAGRFWAGSTAWDFAAGRGALHVLLPDWSTRQVLDGLTQPNGMDWSPDGRTFYLVDSAEATLTAWDFDIAAAQLSRPRLLAHFPASGGAPDGLCVDAAGDLWVAMWGGSALLHLDASGALVRRVELPVWQPTSCAFVGRHRDVLLVTSAAQGLSPTTSAPDGALLSVTGTGARGRPVPVFAG